MRSPSFLDSPPRKLYCTTWKKMKQASCFSFTNSYPCSLSPLKIRSYDKSASQPRIHWPYGLVRLHGRERTQPWNRVCAGGDAAFSVRVDVDSCMYHPVDTIQVTGRSSTSPSVADGGAVSDIVLRILLRCLPLSYVLRLLMLSYDIYICVYKPYF